MAVIHHAAEVIALDGFGNGAPESLRLEPGLLVTVDGSLRGHVKPEEIDIGCGPGVEHMPRSLLGQALVKVGSERIDELQFAPLEAEQFEIAVLLKLQPDGIDKR